MHFNDDKKKLEISVREIAFSAKSSINEGYISRRLRARIGHDAHSIYQSNSEGEKEYYIKFHQSVNDWDVLIRGFVDIVKQNENSIQIEEIKSTTKKMDEIEEDDSHILQIQLYSHYFRKYKQFDEIKAYLIIVDPVNDSTKRIEIQPKPLDKFLNDHLKQLINNHIETRIKREEGKKRVSSIKFPYPSYRPFQEEIMNKLQSAISSQSNPTSPSTIMLHAPPGIGKTITTLLPMLKYGISEAKRLFVVTSKTTQQQIYTETIQDLHEDGAKFKAIKITAKGKICQTDKYDCYDQDCPFLSNYLRFDTKHLVSNLLNLNLIEREPIEEMAWKNQICPFELSLDIASQSDLILSDFNYIFHPRVRFIRFEDEFEDSLLIIDEAHNLVDRAADFYSESLSISHITKIIKFVNKTPVPGQLKHRIKQNLKRLKRRIQHLKDQIPNLEVESSLVDVDRSFFENMQEELDELSIDYINALPIEPQKKDELIKFTDHLKYFTLLLRETDEPEFEEIFDIIKRQVRILCKSAAKKLQEKMVEFDNVIAQSATLQPINYYKDMLGMPEQTKIMKYPNPFPKKNRLYLIEPSISTTYRERSMFHQELANLISRIVRKKEGNYLVFFSSFEYLNNIKNKLSMKNYTILIQQSDMSDAERSNLLSKLKNGKNYLVLAVLGGIFSEGIDYSGEMASGAFIVGPGLPKVSFDQELKKEYFERTYRRGFDYAYKYPGMSKVIQAAGRVFRTEKDQGFVLFIGHRFNSQQYNYVFPEDFDIKVGDVDDQIRSFWEKNKKT